MATSSDALIHALKLLLMSTGVVFIAVLLTPQIFSVSAAQLPSIWLSFRSWLRPPYLYVIINGIIITIAATSRLHHRFTHPHASAPAADSDEFRPIHGHAADDDHFRAASAVSVDPYSFTEPKAAIVPEISPPSIPPIVDYSFFYGEVLDQNHGVVADIETAAFGSEEMSKIAELAVEEVEANPRNHDLTSVDGGSAEPEPEPMVRRSTRKKTPSPPPAPAPLARQETFEVVSSFFQSQIEKPLGGRQIGGIKEVKEEKTANHNPAPLPPAPLARQETSEIVSSFFQTQIEKPPPSARFGQNRRPTKSIPEGANSKALRVAKSKRSETLESTWRTITEGRHMPLTRHLKKSDTFENHSRQPDLSDPSAPSHVAKSDTFTDRTNFTAAAVARLKKDPSLSQDELNRRVEAFINKVNQDMKLERMQSMQQFLETINRAK